jgi:hypothetical protein
MKNIFAYFFLIITFITLTTVLVVSPRELVAAGLVDCGNAELKEGETTLSDACTVGDLFKTVVVITNFLIAFAGLVATLMIVKGGLSMVVSAGNPTGYGSAKKTLTGAIFGLVLVFVAFVLVNTLLAGSLSLGIKNGTSIFTSPSGYIQGPSSGGDSPTK